MSRQTRVLALWSVSALLAFSGPAAAATLTGSVLYNGEPIMLHASNPVGFWARDENAGTVVVAEWVFDAGTSTYSVELPPGTYGVQTHLFEPGIEPGFFPGNYYGFKVLTIPPDAQLVNVDLPMVRLLHLVSPIDNNLREWMAPPYDLYLPDNPIRFAWEPIAEAARYAYQVQEWQNSPYQFVRWAASGSVSSTFVDLQFPATDDGRHYEFELFAYNSDGVFVGRIMIVYDRGVGWDYRFVADWPTPGSIDEAIGSAGPAIFDKNPTARQHALSQKLAEVQALIDQGDYQQALDKLVNDIRSKMDGCSGGVPNNDWITDCAAQAQLLTMVDALIATLEALVP